MTELAEPYEMSIQAVSKHLSVLESAGLVSRTRQAQTRPRSISRRDDLPMITIIREFDAPPAKVFRAHTDPGLYMTWFGPEALESSVVDRWDCRSGGEWRYQSRHEGQDHWFRGCSHEVRPNEVIVQTFGYEGFPDTVLLERLVLTPLDGDRCRLEVTSLADSYEGRDAVVASGMERGSRTGIASSTGC